MTMGITWKKTCPTRSMSRTIGLPASPIKCSATANTTQKKQNLEDVALGKRADDAIREDVDDRIVPVRLLTLGDVATDRSCLLCLVLFSTFPIKGPGTNTPGPRLLCVYGAS
jgi:hypothetical protein